MENVKNNEKLLASLLLIIIGIVGSICVFYMTNLLLSDLSNMFYGVHDAYIIASFPGFFLSLYFILAEIFVFRYFYRPKYRKSLILTYLIIACCFAFIGMIMSIITGAVIYKSFFTPYPFWGYTMICLIVHIFVFCGSIYLHILFKKKLPDDETKRPISIQYVLFSTVLSILVFFAFDRFGAFLVAPVYIHWRTFYLTFPFYLSLLLPAAELVHTVLYMFDYFKKKPMIGFVYSLVMVVADIVLLTTVILLGYNYPQFISAVSPALALERLATKPYDIILTVVIMIGLTGYNLWYSIYRLVKSKKKEAEQQ